MTKEHNCPSMLMWCADPRIPIERAGSGYIMRVDFQRIVKIKYCPFCGIMIDASQDIESGLTGDCQHLKQFIDVSNTLVTFDKELCRYELHGLENMAVILYFCPLCGVDLHPKKRGRHLMGVLLEEEAHILREFAGITTFDELVKKFGRPDREMPGYEDVLYPAGKPARHNVPRTWWYEKLATSIDVLILQQADGTIKLELRAKEIAIE